MHFWYVVDIWAETSRQVSRTTQLGVLTKSGCTSARHDWCTLAGVVAAIKVVDSIAAPGLYISFKLTGPAPSKQQTHSLDLTYFILMWRDAENLS